ncbi:MAG: TrkA family potassium uptake protein [Haloarculaceae archaeon]
MDGGDADRGFGFDVPAEEDLTRRIAYYLLGLVGVMVLYTFIYMAGMAYLEGEPRSFTDALLVVVETFTTTGFGEDAPWIHPLMDLLMVAMQFTGVGFIFLALPVFVAPLIQARLSTAAPTSIEDVAGHVVICGYSSRGEALIDELSGEVRAVLLERDRERAADLHKAGHDVVHGDPESVEALAGVCAADATAIVADVDDEVNASIALAADQVAPETKMITFVENGAVADYHRYAGADHVFSPRQLIGESLAAKVTAGVSTELGDAIEIGEDFEIVELPVQAGAALDGVTVAESNVREQTGANIIGAWFRGEFVTPPAPDAYIDRETILLVAGREEQLSALKAMTLSEERRRRPGPVIIGGHGVVGRTIEDAVADSGLPTVTVDRQELSGVDVVGDVTDEETLRRAGIEDASTVILAVADDTTAVFATLVVHELNPDVEIIARADTVESVRKLYQAGVDYVLSLATVSGRMLASTILGDEVLSFDRQIELLRTEPGSLAGQRLADSDVRSRTGCTVIAVERDDEVRTDVGPDFVPEPGDALVVAGTDDAINEFKALL